MMSKKDLEIYVHIPFCARKCAYCDFLSFPGNMLMQQEYVDKLIEEIYCQSGAFHEYQVISVFMGGGTPSILDGSVILAVMTAIKECFDVHKDAEVTIEANPGTVTMEKLNAYRRAGVNRVSIGLQSADDRELRALGRIHTYDEFLKSYQRILMSGISNINVDLMSALPGQTLESWKNTLKKVVMLKPEHISAYSLIIEEGTPYYERYGKRRRYLLSKEYEYVADLPDLPDEDTEREMYYLTNSYLKEMGYMRYEISNYSKPGRECRHNIGYWTGTQYLGIGLGASSYIDGCRFHNESDFDTYVRAHLTDPEQFARVLRQDREYLTAMDKMEETMFLGLRLMCGVSQKSFTDCLGRNIWDVYGDKIRKLIEAGLLVSEGGFIRLTDKGIDVSNVVLSEFLFD